MKVDNELIDKLASLSRLKFEAGEKETIRQDLEKMIGFVAKLSEVDTTGVKPLSHMAVNRSICRQDEIENLITKNEALKNSRFHDENFFLVPKVIKK